VSALLSLATVTIGAIVAFALVLVLLNR